MALAAAARGKEAAGDTGSVAEAATEEAETHGVAAFTTGHFDQLLLDQM